MKERENIGNDSPKTEGSMEYNVAGIVYIQKPLYLGQIKQLTTLLQNVSWPKKMIVSELILSLSDILNQAFAIVLIEKGKDTPTELKNKDLKFLAESFEFGIDSKTVVRIVNDFFDCNPTDSLWDMMRTLIATVYTPPSAPESSESESQATTEDTGLMSTSPTSVEETSPEETAFSGDSV